MPDEIPEHDLSGAALEIAEALHEAYERLAPAFGYRTRRSSAKPWLRVPVKNRALMVATVFDLMQEGVIWSRCATLAASRIILKAELWDALMDEADRGGEPRAEALRNTARGAAQDWQEAIGG